MFLSEWLPSAFVSLFSFVFLQISIASHSLKRGIWENSTDHQDHDQSFTNEIIIRDQEEEEENNIKEKRKEKDILMLFTEQLVIANRDGKTLLMFVKQIHESTWDV